MKRRFFTVCLMMICLLPLIALADLPKVGDELYGFRLLSIEEVPMEHTRMYTYEHLKTGAQLVHLANEDTDRCFTIAFHTPVHEDTGLPHVFEHAALGGSKKYPNPNLVFSMMYGTYSTYMNAATATTFTYFNTASLSEEQLLVNMDVYLDGVFNPMLIEDEHAMMREAYRYELDAPQDEIILQGVVYSEMQGAVTHESMAQIRLDRLMYPGSVVGTISGGLPEEIPNLTYQQLCDFHEEYYTPSNSLTVLYGDLEIERYLELIDRDYFSKYEKTEADLSDPGYREMDGDVTARVTYPVTQDAEGETIIYYGIPVGDLTPEEAIVLAIDANMISWADHLMDIRMTEELPECTWDISVARNKVGTALLFSASGLTADQAELFRSICDAALEDARESGFDPEDVRVYADNVRYSNALSSEMMDGVSLSSNLIYYWDITGDLRGLIRTNTVLNNLRKLENNGECDRVLAKVMDTAYGHALLISEAVPGGREDMEETWMAGLDDMKASMSEEEINDLIARTEDYNAWVSEQDVEVSLSDVTAITISTLPEEVVRAEAVQEEVDGLTLIYSLIEDTDFIQTQLYLDASACPVDALLPLRVYLFFTDDLDTENRDRQTVIRDGNKVANSLTMSLTTLRDMDAGTWVPYMAITYNTFKDLAEGALDYVTDIFENTKTEDLAYIRSELSADVIDRRNSYTTGIPYLLALTEAARQTDEETAYSLLYSGYNLIQYEEWLLTLEDDKLAAELNKGREAAKYLLHSDHAILTVVGDEEAVELCKNLVSTYLSQFEPMGEPVDWSEAIAGPTGNTAFEIDTGVSYNMEYVTMEDLGIKYTAALGAFTNLAADQVLMPILRFENSVYSIFFQINEDYAFILTYRDPNLTKTFNEIFPILGEELRTSIPDITQEELDGYISSAYTAEATPLGMITRATMAVQSLLTNSDYFDETLENMRSLKQMKLEDIAEYADILDRLYEKGLKVTVTSPQKLQEAEDLFEIVNTDFLK